MSVTAKRGMDRGGRESFVHLPRRTRSTRARPPGFPSPASFQARSPDGGRPTRRRLIATRTGQLRSVFRDAEVRRVSTASNADALSESADGGEATIDLCSETHLESPPRRAPAPFGRTRAPRLTHAVQSVETVVGAVGRHRVAPWYQGSRMIVLAWGSRRRGSHRDRPDTPNIRL